MYGTMCVCMCVLWTFCPDPAAVLAPIPILNPIPIPIPTPIPDIAAMDRQSTWFASYTNSFSNYNYNNYNNYKNNNYNYKNS